MLLLGIDIGTSSIKVSLVDAATKKCIASAQHPEEEAMIISHETGWAEQSPETWWLNTKLALKKLSAKPSYNLSDIGSVGIAYQMHGLVMVDKGQRVLRDSIIWCDSRAVEIGNEAYEKIGVDVCQSCLLNSPGNFTASKLAWVKKHEPELYERIDKIMLPGDFIAMKLTGNITTTSSALSEGIFWDFKNNEISKDVMKHYGFDEKIIPAVSNLFSTHGSVNVEVASELSIPSGIPVSYKAGDQLNNALSLNVFNPGEVAATAGTSGVIYAVTDKLVADKLSRVNAFAHVNHNATSPSGLTNEDGARLGVLLCINGTGIMNSWIKKISGNHSYKEMDEMAATVVAGSNGLTVLPFGNGAERMLGNKQVGAHILNIDLNKHDSLHMFRAVQEGIAFAFRFGFDIMKENGIMPTVIKAGRANMFQSNVFTQVLVDVLQVPVELYENDGSVGAALGSGIGAGIYHTHHEAFANMQPINRIEVSKKKSISKALSEMESRVRNFFVSI